MTRRALPWRSPSLFYRRVSALAHEDSVAARRWSNAVNHEGKRDESNIRYQSKSGDYPTFGDIWTSLTGIRANARAERSNWGAPRVLLVSLRCRGADWPTSRAPKVGFPFVRLPLYLALHARLSMPTTPPRATLAAVGCNMNISLVSPQTYPVPLDDILSTARSLCVLEAGHG